MQMGLAPLGYAWLGLPYDEDTGFADPISIESWLSAYVESDPIQVQSLLFDTYLAVGSTDLTGKLYDLRKFGFSQKIKDYPVPGSRKTVKIHQGAEGAGYSFTVMWYTDRASASAFLNALAAIDDDGTKFYPRDSLWYHKIYLGDAEPDPLVQTWIFEHNCKLYLTNPYLYSEIHQDWDVIAGTLPQTSDLIDNYGHLADGFESIAITGHYVANHVEDLVLAASGGDSMTLSDKLLSDEKITLTVEGALVTEWTAALSSLANFQQDASLAGTVTFSGDHIAIAASSSAIIPLAGPWPTKKPVKVTANLTITGTASIQISTDSGATWTDATTAANIESGSSAIYYLTGSGKVADMQIKFNCPSASTMLIHALKIERELDCSGADLPSVASLGTVTFTVSCDVTKSTSATIAATYHPRRYAI
jgi:hypothetical protein